MAMTLVAFAALGSHGYAWPRAAMGAMAMVAKGLCANLQIE